MVYTYSGAKQQIIDTVKNNPGISSTSTIVVETGEVELPEGKTGTNMFFDIKRKLVEEGKIAEIKGRLYPKGKEVHRYCWYCLQDKNKRFGKCGICNKLHCDDCTPEGCKEMEL